MTPYYADDLVTLHLGDCLDVMAAMTDSSVDAVVCDPPYALEFMGREWDAFTPARFQSWCEAWAAECLRVLKPGGYLLAFGGTRTYHRLACGIEDAGFEVRDSLHWLYGSGFPKSLDVSKAIDKSAGAAREVTGHRPAAVGGTRMTCKDGWERPWMDAEDARAKAREITAPATEDAARWEGWGTALKPGHEPIVVARKPLAAGTVAANVLQFGTGALNIDGCRVAGAVPVVPQSAFGGSNNNIRTAGRSGEMSEAHDAGRWPANIVFTHSASCEMTGTRRVGGSSHPQQHDSQPSGIFADLRAGSRQYGDASGMETVEAWDCAPDCPVAELDRQSGVVKSSGIYNPVDHGPNGNATATSFPTPGVPGTMYGDTGGASRFYPVFRYQAKAPKSERPRLPDGTAWPTVKPVDLMRWLVRLVTPPGGTILDPFAGTGATGEAAALEGFSSLLIERDPVAAELALQRLRKPSQPELLAVTA